MKSISIKYGKNQFSLDIPSSAEIIEPPIVTCPEPDPEFILTAALKNSKLGIEEYLQGGKNVVVVIPDLTRKCRLDLFLPPVLNILAKNGYSDNSLKILIACGTHKYKGLDAYREILSREILENCLIEEHDCDADCVYLTTTSRGTPVEINPTLIEADRIICIGGTLPHYFAGFGGGPKLIAPGCASRKTIEANHRFSVNLDDNLIPGTMTKRLEDNDLIQDIIEAVSSLKTIFHIGIILGTDGQPRDIFAGELFESYYRMIQRAQSLYNVTDRGLADLVIVGTGGHPKDIDLLQTHKSMYHAASALKKGGRMLVYAECLNGAGSDSLKTLIEMGDVRTVKELLSKEYIINGQAAYSLFLMGRMFDVMMVTELAPEFMGFLGFRKMSHREATDMLTKIDNGIKIFYFPSSSTTVYQNNTSLN